MKTRLLFNKDFCKSVTSFSSIWMTSTTVSLIDLPTVLSTRSAWSGSSQAWSMPVKPEEEETVFYYSTHDATLPNGIVKYLMVIHNRDLADGISLSSSSKMVACFIQRPQHCQTHHQFSLLWMFSVAYQQLLTIKSVFLICSDFGQIVFSHWHENEHLTKCSVL